MEQRTGRFLNRARRETGQDAKASRWLGSVFQDITFGCRVLWKDRTAMSAALLSLALALGACSTAFSLIDALILRPLPVSHPERLISLAYPAPLMNAPPGVPREHDRFSYPLYQRFREAAGTDIDLFGVNWPASMQQIVLDDSSGESEPVRVESLSGNAFGLLRIKPFLGRLFSETDDTPLKKPLVAVISHALWTRRFGADGSAIGRWITLGNNQFQIVGVAGKNFTGLEPGYLTDMWIPLTAGVDSRTLAAPEEDWLRVWGQMKPGARPQSLQVAFTNFERDHPRERNTPEPLLFHSAATGADSLFRLQFSRPLWIFGIFSGLLLLIAASNVANLFIARGVGREREMALRIAIGAGRGRLLRQLLIESGLLAAAACIGAVAIGANAAPFLARQLGASNFPSYLDVHPDWRLLAFMGLAGALTTIFFGAIPAFRASQVNPDEALKTSARQSGRAGALKPLLSIQVAFSFMVLFLSGLLLISFGKLIHVNLGFAKDHVILFTLNTKGLAPARQRQVETQLLDRISRMNGVRAASLSQQGLIGGVFAFVMTPSIRFPGRSTEPYRPNHVPVSPHFFETMQIRLLDGRDFETRDIEADSSSTVIVNEAFVRQFFAGQNPIGQRFEQIGDDKPVEQEIVGVVANSLFNNLRETPKPTIYSPLRIVAGTTLEVRTQGDPLALAGTLRREIESTGPGLRVRSSALQSTRIDDTLVSERLLAWIAGFFAIAAIVLVGVGLHGVISYFVVRRTKEIGIRMALGAERSAVVRLVISDVLVLICVGIVAGGASGIGVARYATSLLYEIRPEDVASLAAPLVCILIVCVVATLRPAMQSARVDPVIALRYE